MIFSLLLFNTQELFCRLMLEKGLIFQCIRSMKCSFNTNTLINASQIIQKVKNTKILGRGEDEKGHRKKKRRGREKYVSKGEEGKVIAERDGKKEDEEGEGNAGNILNKIENSRG